MKTNRILSIIICFLCLGILWPSMSYANSGDDDKKEKKEKKKKEKKAYEWVMPKLSGVEGLDDYLLKCDSMNTSIKKYSEDITFYELAKIAVKDENGEVDYQYCMVDSAGNLRGANKAFAQNMDIIMAYPGLVLDMTNLTLATATATTALAGSPLVAISYGKYLKAGPLLVGRAGKEMKIIYQKARAQAQLIKALKSGQTDNLEALNAELYAGIVEGGAASMRVIEMNRPDYDAQYERAQNEDADNPDATEQEIPEMVVD